jgi:hypothetical protein
MKLLSLGDNLFYLIRTHTKFVTDTCKTYGVIALTYQVKCVQVFVRNLEVP